MRRSETTTQTDRKVVENCHRPNVNNSLIIGSVVRFISLSLFLCVCVAFCVYCSFFGNRPLSLAVFVGFLFDSKIKCYLIENGKKVDSIDFDLFKRSAVRYLVIQFSQSHTLSFSALSLANLGEWWCVWSLTSVCAGRSTNYMRTVWFSGIYRSRLISFETRRRSTERKTAKLPDIEH